MSGGLDAPVVVLTGSRHGSTLLRLILDAHPSLGCPAETNVLWVATRLHRVAGLLDDNDEHSLRPTRSVARSAIDALYADYLGRTGKRRWCDKSIDASRYAEDFLEIYPNAQFICLYRHCLDVIDSGIEISPWGLSRFGFRPYAQRHPGNGVAAIADYWVTTTRQTLDFERAYPEICHRICYEDLVGAPEQAAAELFEFLGEPVVPGITETCFTGSLGLTGPGDPKIWATSEVSSRSVGRGARVPIDLIPRAIRTSVEELLAELGYPALGDRYDDVGRRSGPAATDPVTAGVIDEVDRQLGLRLRESLGVLPGASPDWKTAVDGRPVAFVGSPWPDAGSHWRADVEARSCLRSSSDPFDGSAWVVLGEPDALVEVMGGRLNLAVAMRRGLLRIEGPQPGAPRPPADQRMPSGRARREDVLRMQITARLLTGAVTRADESWEE